MKPYRIVLPQPRSGHTPTQGTRVFGPDGQELLTIMGFTIEGPVDSIVTALLRVPVVIEYASYAEPPPATP